jgi:sec-independent protein translocase protein TatA
LLFRNGATIIEVIMSGQEIFVIIIVALLLFGAEKLPDIAKTIGRGMRDFKKATDEIRRELENSTQDIRRDAKEVSESIKNDVSDFRNNIEKEANEVTDSIRNNKNNIRSGVQQEVKDLSDVIQNDGTPSPSSGSATKKEAPKLYDKVKEEEEDSANGYYGLP